VVLSNSETSRGRPGRAIAAGLGHARGLLRGATDALLPPRCLRCNDMVDSPHALCPACWGQLSFVVPPLCAHCGTPFPYAQAAGAICGACAAAPPVYARARAALVYDDGSRDLVLAFKHGDRLAGTALFGQWLGQAGAELLADADVVAPVPLHRWRLLGRRYNQAALLARAVARHAGIEPVPDLLSRLRATPSQGARGRAARERNVRGAFAVRARHRRMLAGQRVLLIDDVLTTGATLEACSRALSQAGAAAVDVLTLARVVRSLPPSI